MSYALKSGASSRYGLIRIVDLTGAPISGLTHASGGLSLAYYRVGAASATTITAASMTLGTWVSSGFAEISSSLFKGLYLVGLPNAATTAGADLVVVGGAYTGGVVLFLGVCPVAFDPQDAQRLGLAGLPASGTASTYAGGDTAGVTTLLTRVTGAVPLVSDWTPTRAGKLDHLTGDAYARLGSPAGASIAADIATRSTYAGADTAGVATLLTRVTGAVPLVSDWTPTRAGKLDHLTGDAYARLGSPAGASIAADIASRQPSGAVALTSDERTAVAAAVLAGGDLDGKTLAELLKILAAMLAGKVSGAGSGTETFKGLDGSTTRAVVTVDSDGNRTGVAYS